MVSINYLSLTSFKIEMCREDAKSDKVITLSTATAFFMILMGRFI